MIEDSLPEIITVIKQNLPTLKAAEVNTAGLKKSAVLVPLFYNDRKDLCTVFIKRPLTMRNHKGDYAFPGGSLEEGETSRQAALREAEEELGIIPVKVEALGEMPLMCTLTGFCIRPVVGWLEEKPEFIPSPDEVDEILVARLDDLIDPKNCEARPIKGLQGRKNIYYIYLNGRTIWGATAHIVKLLSKVLINS